MNEVIAPRTKLSACLWAIGSTLVYLGLAPFAFQVALLSFMIADSPIRNPIVALMIVFVIFCVPFSMLVSVFFIWLRFYQKEYSKTFFHCFVPILTLIACSCLVYLLGLFV